MVSCDFPLAEHVDLIDEDPGESNKTLRSIT